MSVLEPVGRSSIPTSSQTDRYVGGLRMKSRGRRVVRGPFSALGRALRAVVSQAGLSLSNGPGSSQSYVRTPNGSSEYLTQSTKET